MLIILVSLRKIPLRPLGLVVAPTTENSRAGVLIDVFICPLPNVADHVHHAERACSRRMCINIIRTSHSAPTIRRRYGTRFPRIAPWIDATVGSLGRILPLPFVWQSFFGPLGIVARVLERNPSDWLVRPSLWIRPVCPVSKKVRIILRVIVSCLEKLLEVKVGDGVLVNVERLYLHAVFVKAARRVFPRILHINTNVIGAFNLNPFNLEGEIGASNLNHAGRRSIRGFGGGDLYQVLAQRLPLVGVARQ